MPVLCNPQVYAQPAQIQRNGAQLAADASARTLRFLSEKFDFPYEMPKMDAIAVPRDYFGPGAMENWGLVTYRYASVLSCNVTESP